MATAKFTLYDLVVDLIPGVIALLLFFWLFQPANLEELVQIYGTALPAIAFLAAGYVIGRVIHSISNIDYIEKFAVKIHNLNPLWKSVEPRDRKFSNRVAYLRHNVEEKSLEKATAMKAQKHLYNQMGIDDFSDDYEEGDAEAFEKGSIGKIPDLRYARYLSDTVTYQNQSLSWKYGILATYFRNMWIVLIAAAFLYVGVRQLESSIGIFILLLVSGLICLQQRFKFKRRQIRTMINELSVMADAETTD